MLSESRVVVSDGGCQAFWLGEDEVGASGHVDDDPGERLVEGDGAVGESTDAAAVSEGLAEGRGQRGSRAVFRRPCPDTVTLPVSEAGG